MFFICFKKFYATTGILLKFKSLQVAVFQFYSTSLKLNSAIEKLNRSNKTNGLLKKVRRGTQSRVFSEYNVLIVELKTLSKTFLPYYRNRRIFFPYPFISHSSGLFRIAVLLAASAVDREAVFLTTRNAYRTHKFR